MTPIEHHWTDLTKRLNTDELNAEQLAFLREMFFGGALSMLMILSELNDAVKDDAEFDKRMDELFREASSGVLARYRFCKHEFVSVRRH